MASLEDVRLLLLATLGEATVVAGIPILELVASHEHAERRHAQVRWPCSAEQLERSIEASLLARSSEEARWDGLQACVTEERWSA